MTDTTTDTGELHGPVERRLSLRLDEDEVELQAVVRAFLADVVSPPSATATSWDELDPEGKVWQRMAGELGLQGLAVPEELGGQGFGMTALAVVFHELGRATCAAPLLGSVALAGRLLTHLPAGTERDRLLTGLADGSLRATVVTDDEGLTLDGDLLHGSSSAVIDLPQADVVLLCVGDRVVSVAADATGLEVRRQDGMDLARELGELRADAVGTTTLAEGVTAEIQRALAEATVLLAAELCGVSEAALDEAVAYAKVRRQFGRQIGSFQALKHRMADMLVASEGAWTCTRHAAVLCSETDPVATADELVRAVGVAKAAASSAATFVTGENIQVHGGMGFTWEHPAHLRFRRARSAAVLLGSPTRHRIAVAAALTTGLTSGGPHGPA